VEENPTEEAVPQNLIGSEAIRVRHLRKTYYTSLFGSDCVEAVKGISMNIYEGQITAILGRNGAGKSTLFNMLIGLVSPTSGTSRVFGLDISLVKVITLLINCFLYSYQSDGLNLYFVKGSL